MNTLSRIVLHSTVALCGLALLAGPAAAATTSGALGDGTASILYAEPTGHLIVYSDLNGTDTPLDGLRVDSAGGLYSGNVNLPQETLYPGTAEEEEVYPIAVTDSQQVGFISLDANPDATVLVSTGWDLGQVLDPGLSESAVLADLTIEYSVWGIVVSDDPDEPVPQTEQGDLLYGKAGDTDLDRDVDSTDIQNILGAGGLQASGATWATGDNDQDGDVDSTDIQNILAQGAFPNDYAMAPGSDGDGTVDLLFDGAQGLSIDTDGATINGFILSSSTGVLTGSAADLSDVTGFFVTDTNEEISSQFGYAFNGVTDLGEVLAPGLSLDDLAADLTMTYTVEGQSGVFDATIVPEPMTMSLLAVGGLGVLIRRKRR